MNKLNSIYNIIIGLVLMAFTVIGLVLWLSGSGLKEFGLNFFTEMLGVVITVFVIDALQKRREEQKLLPLRIISFNEVSLLFNRCSSLFFSLYEQSVDEDCPHTTEEFINSDCLYKALIYTDARKDYAVEPASPLGSYLRETVKDLMNRSETIIDKYALYIEPEIIIALHQLFNNSPFINTLLTVDRSIIIQDKYRPEEFARSSSLSAYVVWPNAKFNKEFIRLYKWLVNEREYLLKYDPEIRDIATPKYLARREDRRNFNLRLEDGREIAWQLQNFESNKARANS